MSRVKPEPAPSDEPGKRPVIFPRRQENARRTRQALVTAAAELFVTIGYTSATIQAIADRAGVARPTVFTSVPGGKPELLKLARDQAIAGDDEPVPIPQRSWFIQAMSQPDPAELLRLQAANYRRILDRAGALEHVLAIAASTDAALQELHTQARGQRYQGAVMVASRLDDLGALCRQLTARRAADTIYALAGPDVYRLLTGDRGWSGDQYQEWLGNQLRNALLRA